MSRQTTPEINKVKPKQKMGAWLAGNKPGETKPEIADIPIKDIKPNPKNPRTITEYQSEALKRSINKFGFLQPIVVNKRNMQIVSGHQRLEAYKSLNKATVPVIFVNLNDKEEQALNVSMNRVGGEFKQEGLVDIIKDLQGQTNLLETTGLESKEIEALLEQMNKASDKGENIADQDKKNREKAKMPDLNEIPKIYKLGEHRLLWGDCTNPGHMKLLMGSDKADMIWTDPPYGIAYKTSSTKRSDKIGRGILNDALNKNQFKILLSGFLQNAVSFSKDNAAWYICFGYQTLYILMPLMFRNDLKVHTYIIWVKDRQTFGMVDNYMHKYELILYASRTNMRPYFAQLIKDTKLNEGYNTDVWQVDKVVDMTHPNEKPVELIKIALQNSSRINEIVLDPFSGSGSCLEACMQTSRIFRGSELDKRHVETIIERYEKITGKKAEIEK